MSYCKLTMQETKFLIALLENGITSKQTSLQLLAAEHLYVPTLLPKLRDYAKRLDRVETLEQCLENSEATMDDFVLFLAFLLQGSTVGLFLQFQFHLGLFFYFKLLLLLLHFRAQFLDGLGLFPSEGVVLTHVAGPSQGLIEVRGGPNQQGRIVGMHFAVVLPQKGGVSLFQSLQVRVEG